MRIISGTWLYCAVLGYTGLGGTGMHWALLGSTGLYWAVLGYNGLY